MKKNNKTFDAVVESRKWKEAVTRETEGMSREQVIAFFDHDAVQHRFQIALEHSNKE